MPIVTLPAPGQVWEQRLAEVTNRPRVLLLLAVLFGLPISGVPYPTPDAVGYLCIARAIGQGHVLANRGSPQLYYPVGYPLLISPLFALADRPFLLLSVLHAGLMLAFVYGVYLWARRCLPAAAVWVALLTGVNFVVTAMARRALSENAFMAVMIWLTLLLDSLARDTGARPVGRTLLAAVLMTLLAAIRPAGILLAAGFGTYLALAAWRGRLRWSQVLGRTLGVGVPASLVLLGLVAYDRAMARAAGTPTYLDQVIDAERCLPEQLLEGVRLRVSDVGRLTVPGMFKACGRRGDWMNPNMLIYIPLATLFAGGWVKLLRRRPDVLAWTFPFHLVLHTVWPFDQAGRFLLPFLPLLFVCLWLSLARLAAYQYRVAALLVAAHLAVSLGYWLRADLPRARAELRRWPAIDRVAERIRPNYRPVAVSSALGDAWLFLNYSLDRPADLLPEGQPVPRKFGWLVVPRQAPVFAGFASVAEWGDCRLLRRKN